MIRRKTLADLTGAVALVYASLWIYELSNYAAFHFVGLSAGLTMDGILPAGVAAITAMGGNLFLVKPIQVAVSCAAAGVIYYVARKVDAPILSMVAVTSLSLFAASFYWEFLSPVGPLPLAVHEALYTLLSLGGLIALSRADPKLKVLIW